MSGTVSGRDGSNIEIAQQISEMLGLKPYPTRGFVAEITTVS